MYGIIYNCSIVFFHWTRAVDSKAMRSSILHNYTRWFSRCIFCISKCS